MFPRKYCKYALKCRHYLISNALIQRVVLATYRYLRDHTETEKPLDVGFIILYTIQERTLIIER